MRQRAIDLNADIYKENLPATSLRVQWRLRFEHAQLA